MYYADKTQYIPTMEAAGNFLSLIRPRRYPEVAHSYILELKHLTARNTEAEAERQWTDATAQVRRCARDRKVGELARDTQLHLIAMQMRGSELLRIEEVAQGGD